MLDLQKATEILENHFANLSREQFMANLEKYCPELFEEQSEYVDLYSQGKAEGKLEIIPKIKKKGLNTDEVAEVLGLDIKIVQHTAHKTSN